VHNVYAVEEARSTKVTFGEMAVLSILRLNCNRAQLILNKANQLKIQQRFSGHGRELDIQSSNLYWRKFKDQWHFYTLLGVIPLTIVTAWANVFIGQAELTEIPEGYQPYVWEYEKHPVSRFFARYLFLDPRQAHERKLHIINIESEKMIMRRIEATVQSMMAQRHDYQAWFYRPVWGMYHRIEREKYTWQQEYFGFERGIEKEHGTWNSPVTHGDPAPDA